MQALNEKKKKKQRQTKKKKGKEKQKIDSRIKLRNNPVTKITRKNAI